MQKEQGGCELDPAGTVRAQRGAPFAGLVQGILQVEQAPCSGKTRYGHQAERSLDSCSRLFAPVTLGDSLGVSEPPLVCLFTWG